MIVYISLLGSLLPYKPLPTGNDRLLSSLSENMKLNIDVTCKPKCVLYSGCI